MKRSTRLLLLAGYLILFLLAMSGVALADPLDDAGAKVGSFLQRAGVIMTGLIPAAAGLAVGALAVKRSFDKTLGNEDGMMRSGNQIAEVLKLAAIGTGGSLLVAVAGSILS